MASRLMAALISLADLGSGVVAPGSTFTVINNTSSAPITGAFANLPESSSFTPGAKTYQASYLGGTGDDLVLAAQ